MDPIHLDSQSQDVNESPYYKKIRETLKKKAEATKVDAAKEVAIQEEVSRVAFSGEDKKTTSGFDIEDTVHLSALSFEDTFLSDDFEKNEKSGKEKDKQVQELRANGERVLRYLGHKIDFQSKIPDLKILLKESIIQARSHNFFLSQFAKFKVGVIGQILSALQIPISELKKLKQDAIKDAFDENVELMGENLYNRELSELLGHSRRKRKMAKVYTQVQSQLLTQMNNLGRVGYWSKSRLLEEKIIQLKRIHDEFQKEMNNLEYILEYKLQFEKKVA